MATVKKARHYLSVPVRDNDGPEWFHTHCGDWHPIVDGQLTCPMWDTLARVFDFELPHIRPVVE